MEINFGFTDAALAAEPQLPQLVPQRGSHPDLFGIPALQPGELVYLHGLPDSRPLVLLARSWRISPTQVTLNLIFDLATAQAA